LPKPEPTNNPHQRNTRPRPYRICNSQRYLIKDLIDTAENRPKRDTRFKAGNNANPKGRPVGSGIQGQLRKQLEEASPEIVAKLIESAKAGDSMAMRVVLEKLIPNQKPQLPPLAITIPDGSLLERANAALDAAIKGEVSPDQAASIISMGNDIARLKEYEELEKRLIVLEQKAQRS